MDSIAVKFNKVDYRVATGQQLITSLDLEIKTGETLVLLGRSGSGKTTTLKLINRLLEPTSGEISVLGRAGQNWALIELRRRIGYVIQEGGLFPHYTVAENIALVPQLERWPRERIEARVDQLLQLIGMPRAEFAHRYPAQLSGGQRQRVGIARALAADPPLLLLDEPFGALDPIIRRQLQQEFRELMQRLGKTAIFVTHDLREALSLASRIGLMAAGRLIVLATPRDFLRSQHPEARAFLECLKED
jgi:osmoprotectant transport system ATP-binding protein